MKNTLCAGGRHIRCCGFILLIMVVCITPALAAPVDALFEIRLDAGETDAQLTIGEALYLELWLTLSSSAAIPNMTGVSHFLELDPAENNVLWFNDDYIDDTALGYTQPNDPPDNTPITGEFSRSSMSLNGIGVPVQNGQAMRIGRFSVTAIGEGTVSYSFGDDGDCRVWGVGLRGTQERPQCWPIPGTAAFTIAVLPEPSAALMLLTLAGVSCWGRVGLGRSRP